MPGKFNSKSNIWEVVALICLSAMGFLSLSCNGQEGPVGPQGSQGPRGPVGPQGPSGPPGSNATGDKQVRFTFNVAEGSSDSTWQMCPPYTEITRFNISDYDSLDSAVFGAYMGTTSPGAECEVDLFDVTDSTEIAGSTLFTNVSGTQFTWPWVYSNNILSSFPSREITLAVRVRSNQPGTLAQVDNAVLLLYRR
jgi:hypothetical protein